MAMRASAAGLLPALVLLAACAAGRVPVTPLDGVPEVARDGADWSLYVPDGRGEVRVELPPHGSLRLRLFYARGEPFTTLGSVEVVDNVTGSRHADAYTGVTDDGRQRVWVTAGAQPLDLMIRIDDGSAGR